MSLEKDGISTEIVESKRTTGGMLAIIQTNLYDEIINIKIETSQRKKIVIGERKLVISDFFPPYAVQILKQNLMIGEKVDALFSRSKPRDFYDLYYILRANLLSPTAKEKIKDALGLLSKTRISFNKELKIFLPKSHWGIIKDFKKSLEQEIRRVI